MNSTVNDKLFYLVFENYTIATLISPALFAFPPNAKSRCLPKTRCGRVAHTISLYILPLVIYIPVGMVCHLYLFQDNAITFDTSSGHLVQAAIFGAIYCGAPLIYLFLAAIYYKVCIPSNPFKSRFFKNYIFIGLPQLVTIYFKQRWRWWNWTKCLHRWRSDCRIKWSLQRGLQQKKFKSPWNFSNMIIRLSFEK